MPYPRKIQFNSGHPHFDVVNSEREYIVYKIDTTTTPDPSDYYDRDGDRAFRLFYEDDETGIVTRDISKFEAWMRTIVTQAPRG